MYKIHNYDYSSSIIRSTFDIFYEGSLSYFFNTDLKKKTKKISLIDKHVKTIVLRIWNFLEAITECMIVQDMFFFPWST